MENCPQILVIQGGSSVYDRRVGYWKDPRVDAYIEALPGWQQLICARIRDLVHAVDPDVEEMVKRRVQHYFVPDPDGVITGGHDNSTALTVAIRQGEKINEPALSKILRQIVANNRAGGWRKLKAAGRLSAS